MEQNLVRKASVESIGSLGSSTHSSSKESSSKPVADITDSAPVEEKENRSPENTSAASETPENPKHITSPRPISLLLTESFLTSASRSDHCPQKILRVSQESLVRSASVRVAPTTSSNIDPVNKVRRSSTSSLNSADNTSHSTKGDESSSTSSGIKILPAYRGQTVIEMMENMTPKATWHTNTKYNKSRSDSAMRNHRHHPQPQQVPPAALHPTVNYPPPARPPAPQQHTSHTVGFQRPPAPQRTPTEATPPRPNIQRGRQSLQPRPFFSQPEPRSKPVAPHIRYYSPELRSSPTTNFVPRRVFVNDGTHPRMPMRATTPQTYHGQPVQGYSTMPRYSQTPENVYSNVQYGTYHASNGHNNYSQSHHDVRNQRLSLENRQPQRPAPNVRTANSENNIHRQNNKTQPPHRAQSMNMNTNVRSGPYVASSSSMNNLQYAQLMTTSQRTDSSGSVSKQTQPYQPPINDTRHSYTLGYRSDSSSRSRDMYDTGSLTRMAAGQEPKRGPQSPVSRNPSYLNATNSPLKAAYQQQKSIAESSESRHGSSREASHSDLSGTGSESPVVMREKPAMNNYENQARISRRTSYLIATNKPEGIIMGEENAKTPNAKPINFQKVKNFFGEKTPSIKEAIEKAKAPASPMEPIALPNDMNVQKVGILVVKNLAIEGKKSGDRSWKAMGAALCGHQLYLLKDKKENATVLTTPNGPFMVEEKPVPIQNCVIDIAHHYTKKKHVFWLDTKNACKYMFQAESHADMMTWIRCIMENSTTENMSSLKSERLTSAELIKRINDQQGKIQQQKKKLTSLSFKSKNSTSTLSSKNNSESGKKDKKRPQFGTPRSLAFGVQTPVGDFGIPISECKPSHENEYVPWVVESCTKTIEERGMEVVGIYRVPGNKAAVSQLINELNEGVIDFTNDRWNDVNVLSSLLKQFFRSLPDSLITAAKYPEFMQNNAISDSAQRLMSLKQLVRSLPETNFETLKYLAAHLNKVAQYEETNKMDTRNLAIVFGPTILRASDSDDSIMAFVNDMSAQYKVMESMIIYHDWMFSEDNSPPPDRSLNESANAAISQTMNDMSADISKLAGTSQSKTQLMSAFTNAANKNMSKSALKSPTVSKEQMVPKKPPRDDADDHGFKNRDIQEQVAARNRSIQYHNQQREQLNNSIHPSPSHSQNTINPPGFSASEEWSAALHAQMHTTDYSMQLNPRWHSEESILANENPRHALKVVLKNQPGAAFSRSEHQLNPPPVPSRDGNRPPLPPKPLKLYRAVPAQTGFSSPDYPQHAPLSAGYSQNKTFYENYDDFTGPQKMPLRKEKSLARRGSLDSLMDKYEPPQFSDSEDESDLVTTMENEWAQRSKTVFPTYQNQSFDQSQQNYTTQSSDRSRESLLSILSNKEVINNYETSSSHEICSSDRGSYSSLGSQPHRNETKVGIAFRFERNDNKPVDYPVQYSTQQSPLVVNATGTVNKPCMSPSSGEATNSEEEKDFHNNNVSHFMHRRRMSDEKKKIRRRHTVGGARDFEALKDMMPEFNQMKLSEQDMNEANRLINAKGNALSAWEQLNLGDSGDQVTIQKWLERQRYRSSATDIDMHNTPNIMHFNRVGTRLAGPNVLQTNT